MTDYPELVLNATSTLFNAEPATAQSVLFSSVAILISAWIALSAYMLFRHPDMLERWKGLNLGNVSVIALLGFTTFIPAFLFVVWYRTALADGNMYGTFGQMLVVQVLGTMGYLFCYHDPQEKPSGLTFIPPTVPKIIKKMPRLTLWLLYLYIVAGIWSTLPTSGKWFLSSAAIILPVLLYIMQKGHKKERK